MDFKTKKGIARKVGVSVEAVAEAYHELYPEETGKIPQKPKKEPKKEPGIITRVMQQMGENRKRVDATEVERKRQYREECRRDDEKRQARRAWNADSRQASGPLAFAEGSKLEKDLVRAARLGQYDLQFFKVPQDWYVEDGASIELFDGRIFWKWGGEWLARSVFERKVTDYRLREEGRIS